MSMAETHDWEMLDMNKITVYLADIKATIDNVGRDINDRLDKLEDRVDKIEKGVEETRNTIDNNYKHYERNKILYMEILERLSITNDKVRPLLEKLNMDNKRLCNPIIQSSRIYNRFWRKSAIPITAEKIPTFLEDIKEIDESEDFFV